MKNKRIIAFVLTLIITLGLIVIPAQAAGLDQIKNGEMNETSNGALSSWEPVLISAAGCDDNTTSRQTGNVNIGGTQFNATNGAYAMVRSLSGGAVPFNAALSQTMLLPNGTYTLNAMARNNIAAGDDEAAYARIVVTTSAGTLTHNLTRGEGWTQQTIPNIVVTDCKVTVAFEINSTTTGTNTAAGRALAFDRVTLTNASAAQISGVVRDSAGELVPYVYMEYLDAQGETAAFSGTDQNGAYTISAAPGTYTVRIEKAGFEDIRETIVIADGSTRTENYAFDSQAKDLYSEIPLFGDYPDPVGDGRTYYISYSGGSDDNDGLSPETPWKTLSNVASTNSYAAGSVILLKAGDIWPQSSLTTGIAGTEEAPITVGRYVDPEAPSDALPRIDANYAPETPLEEMSASTNPNTNPALNVNRSYWHIYDLELTNWVYHNPMRTHARETGITGARVQNQNGRNSEGVKLSNLYIHHVNGANPKDGGGYNNASGSGLRFTTNGAYRINNLTIENCLMKHVSRNGIVGSGYAQNRVWSMPSSDPNIGNVYRGNNVVIRGNVLEDIWGDGILIGGTYKCLVESNLVINSVSHPYKYPELSGNATQNLSAAVWPFDADATIFQYNEVCYTGCPRATEVADGQAFDADYYTTNNLYQYNYTHDNEGGFFMACGPEYSYSEGTVVRYNISVNDGSMHGKRAIFEIGGGGGVDNTWIYNNTIYTSPDHAVFQVTRGEPWDGKTRGTMFVNNIFSINGKTAQFGWPGDGRDKNQDFSAILDHNLYHGSLFGPGLHDMPPDKNPIFGDPKFENPGKAAAVSGGYGREWANNYRITEGSAAIGAGISIDYEDLGQVMDTRYYRYGASSRTKADIFNVAQGVEYEWVPLFGDMPSVDFFDNLVPMVGPRDIGAHQLSSFESAAEVKIIDGETASVTVMNGTDEPAGFMLFIAEYDKNGKMIGSTRSDYEAPANDILKLTKEIVKADKTRLVKAFLWRAESYIPLCEFASQEIVPEPISSGPIYIPAENFGQVAANAGGLAEGLLRSGTSSRTGASFLNDPASYWSGNATGTSTVSSSRALFMRMELPEDVDVAEVSNITLQFTTQEQHNSGAIVMALFSLNEALPANVAGMTVQGGAAAAAAKSAYSCKELVAESAAVSSSAGRPVTFDLTAYAKANPELRAFEFEMLPSANMLTLYGAGAANESFRPQFIIEWPAED